MIWYVDYNLCFETDICHTLGFMMQNAISWSLSSWVSVVSARDILHCGTTTSKWLYLWARKYVLATTTEHLWPTNHITQTMWLRTCCHFLYLLPVCILWLCSTCHKVRWQFRKKKRFMLDLDCLKDRRSWYFADWNDFDHKVDMINGNPYPTCLVIQHTL